LLSIWKMVKEIAKSNVNAVHGPVRKGDILSSLADVSFAKEILGYKPESDLKRALTEAVEYYKGL